MDDGEVVAALAAGDPAGLAAAYDAYAAPLYGYCRWMLPDARNAAEALRETFALAATERNGPRDASRLRAWFYATARQECRRRAQPAGAGFDETAGEPGLGAQEAEVRRLILATLAGLEPDQHEVIELSVRHNLDEAELAAVLDVSWSRAHALAARAREHLEKSLGALLIARTGRQSCPGLAALLADWDGRLTAATGKLTAEHVEHCETCASRNWGTLRPEVLSRLLPLAALPPEWREPILAHIAAGSAPPPRRPPARRAGTFLGWSKIRANPGAATAVAAVTVWVVAAMSATLITLTGGHAVRAQPPRATLRQLPRAPRRPAARRRPPHVRMARHRLDRPLRPPQAWSPRSI